jgi:crotonobetaine/carnitine-CoA ligase
MRTYRAFTPTFERTEDWNLPSILRTRAESHGSRTLLDFPLTGEQWTYSEMLELSERVASALLTHCRPGDRVLVMSSNRPEFVFSWFGIALAGLVQVPVSTALTGRFLEHPVRTVKPAVCIIEPEYRPLIEDLGDAGDSIRQVYVMGDGADTAAAVRTLNDGGHHATPFGTLFDADPIRLPSISVRDPAAIFFTSGTTGPAKGVVMPHAQIAFFADELVSVTRLTDHDTYMACNPLFHGNAQFLAAYPAIIAGARFVLRERFSASNWRNWLSESGVTVTNLMGAMFDFIWKQPATPEDIENPLRAIFSIPTPVFGAGFQQRFGIEALVEAYGMTEVSMPILTPYGEPRPVGSCGLLVDEWFEVRIVDSDTDAEVPIGELGELVIRPKEPWTTTSGYFGMPDRTVEAFRNLWFHTGDQARRDEDGWLYFVDRLSDAIRHRGENVSSYEVEQAVAEHPSVIECAAVSVPAAEGTEDDIALFVVVHPGTDAETVRQWANQVLPAFARPRDVHVIHELPRTPSGKVKKVELRRAAGARG